MNSPGEIGRKKVVLICQSSLGLNSDALQSDFTLALEWAIALPMRSTRPAAGKELEEDNDQGDDEQQMDQRAGNLEGEADSPEGEQNNGYCPKHQNSPSSFCIRSIANAEATGDVPEKAQPIAVAAWPGLNRQAGFGQAYPSSGRWIWRAVRCPALHGPSLKPI